ncbi:hypothetical protein M9H77_32073 [Catharanthus roseus]|uniref:Uncharacterized protein n=1 Tax=Catharanthus roseus TaxID=4058 RepID=A0ACC0A5R5_CATRO|nr:hypothetical protein M9H77_32073 [Catharanthus roseus]
MDELEGFCDLLGKPTGRKSAIKRTEPDLNPLESENEAISNSLEKETVATPPFRCSTHVVNEVIKRLNDEQREAVVRRGFGSMLELRTCSLADDLFSWMTDQYNSKRGCFRLHGKDIRVAAEDMHRILGLRISETDIESLLVQGGGGGGGGGGKRET